MSRLRKPQLQKHRNRPGTGRMDCGLEAVTYPLPLIDPCHAGTEGIVLVVLEDID